MPMRVHHPLFAILSLTLLSGADLIAQQRESALPELDRLLPERIEPWRAGGTDLHHLPDNLYEYIDGGAEMFLSYGFSDGMSRTYVCEDQPDIVVDVFDMATAANAFGVFAQSMEQVDSTYGQGCQIFRGMIVFWKDRYYVSMLAVPSTDASQRAMALLASTIDARIPRRGALPALLSLLPQDSLQRPSIRYFTHYVWLNSAFFMSDENILDIGPGTEAALARYAIEGTTLHLLLVQYADARHALGAEKHFRSAYGPLKSSTPSAVDQPPVRLRRSGRILMLAFGAATEHAVDTLFQNIESKQQRGLQK